VAPAAPAALTPAARRRERLFVPLGALLIAGLVTLLGSADFRADQGSYNLLVLKWLDPSLFARDVLYRYDPGLLHVPWFIALQASIARALGGDADAALVWLAWPMGALYLGGHYALFRTLGASRGGATLGALAALTVRNTLGGEYWGFDGVRAAATRTIMAGLTPLLFVLFLRWRTRPTFPAFFALLGVLFNVHPVSAYHLAQATGLAHLILERLRPRAIGQMAMGAVLFVLGTLPYVLTFFPARDNAADPATLALTRQALDYRFAYLLYPQTPAAMLSVAFHASLLIAVWLVWRARHRPDASLRTLHVVAGCALVIGLAGPAVVQATAALSGRPYFDIQYFRATRLVYPVLLTVLALTFTRLLATPSFRARAAAAALFAVAMVPPGALIHAFGDEQRAVVKRWLGMAMPPPAVVTAAAAPDPTPEMWAWLRRSTPRDALVFTDSWDVRIETLRSVTGSFKDGAFLFLTGNRPFTAWYRRQREIDACRAALGRDCWFAMARRTDAEYVVVDPGLREAGTPADFERMWEGAGWAVWRRRA
jgi:hypothetical protein